MPNTSYRVFGTSETYTTLVTPASGNDAATTATITGGNPLGQMTWVVADAVGEYLDIGDIAAKGRSGSGAWQAMTITSRDAASGTITLSTTPQAAGYDSFRLYRKTQTEPLVNFVDGARLTESDLDKAYRQGLFAAQEVAEDAEGIGNLSTANLTLSGTTTVNDLAINGTLTGIETGTVLQMVVQSTSALFSSNNNNTWREYLSASITPKLSNSNILVQHSVWYSSNNNGYGAGKVARTISGGSEVPLRHGNSNFTDTRFTDASFPMHSITNGQYKFYNSNFVFEDSPSTTSAITYKCYTKEDAAGTDIVINRTYSNPLDGYNTPAGTTLILTEIAQ